MVSSPNLSVCLRLEGVKNPGSPGKSHTFLASLYNPVLNVLNYQNYPNLNSFNTMTFVKDKLAITIGAIGDFSPMTCSLPVSVIL